MNILVIGNGFDIAHKLPTAYKNYLQTVEVIKDLKNLNKTCNDKTFLWNRIKMSSTESGKGLSKKDGALWDKVKKEDIPKSLWERLDSLAGNRKCETNIITTLNLGEKNFWIKVFMKNIEGTWIDFERDIKYICDIIEQVINIEHISLEEQIKWEKISEIEKLIDDNEKSKIKNYRQLLNKMEDDLKNVMSSFDCYIAEYINKQEIDVVLPDIIEIEVDKVLSFNYSNTFERQYNFRRNVSFCYVHGKALPINDRMIRSYGNIVMGYERSQFEEPFTVPFKKYYQKVLIGADDQYHDWIKEIEQDEANGSTIQHNVYFFGHSLDVTDKEVICGLILHKNVRTTIFYYSYDDKKNKVKNLVLTLGYENFINNTKRGKISFVRQKQEIYKNDKHRQEYKQKEIVRDLFNYPFISKKKYLTICDEILSDKIRWKKKYIYLSIYALQRFGVEEKLCEKLLEKLEKDEDLKNDKYDLSSFSLDLPRYWKEDNDYKPNPDKPEKFCISSTF